MTADPARPADQSELLAAAVHLLLARYTPRRHAVAAAIASADGHAHLGLHLGASVASASVCAEGVALGAALTSGATALTALVTVHHIDAAPGWRPVTPCGSCRELLIDHAPGLHVLVPDGSDDTVGALRPVPIESLLPARFTRG